MSERQTALDRLDKEYHRIARSIQKFDLQKIDGVDAGLGFEEVFGDLQSHASSELLMGFYSLRGMDMALERYGVRKALAQRGFPNARLELDLSDPYRHRMMLVDADASAPRGENRLAELHLHRVTSPEERDFQPDIRKGCSDFLMIDWLCLQNPRQGFSADRPALPGQNHPGLGIGPEVMEMIQILAERLGLAGIVTRPQYYHNAALYSLRYHFIDPICEGRLLALMRDLNGKSLSEASWAVHLGAVLCRENGRPVSWFGREQVFALNRGVARYFESADYRRRRVEWTVKSRFHLDEAEFRRLKCDSREYHEAQGASGTDSASPSPIE